MAYLLDANVFIQAKNLHYGLDFCPAFWDWLLWKNEAGAVCSIEKVGDELTAGEDDLAEWASKRGPEFFLRPTPEILPAFATLTAWVSTRRYEPAAVSGFLQSTDYYLVAHALAHGHVLVGHEVPSNTLKKVKIPDACIGVGVKHVRTHEMLRSERARFALQR